MEDVADVAMASSRLSSTTPSSTARIGQDCARCCSALRSADLSVWLDMQAHDLTAQGEGRPVQSRAALLFLSDGVMARDFGIRSFAGPKKWVQVCRRDGR